VQTPSVDAREYLADVEVILLGAREVRASAHKQLEAACGSIRQADDMLQALRMLTAPASGWIRRRVVVLTGEDALALVTGEGPLKLAELEATHPDGLFLMAASIGGLPGEVTRRTVLAVLREDRLVDDLKRAMRFARRGDSAGPVRQPAIRRRDRGLKILVADDNRVNQKVIRLILEAGGHGVVVAENGEKALDQLESQTFDAVVMDLNMPVMDGLEATKLYRMGAAGDRRVPIIGLTADATPAAARRAEEAGMDACLTKPVNGALLLDRIDELTADQAPAEPEARGVGPAPAVTTHRDPIDVAMLENLKALGGPAFLEEVISAFLVDGEGILADLQAAVVEGDVTAFMEKAHALQSGAGNIGVQRLAERCRRWRPRSADDLKANGPEVLMELRADFETARSRFLREYVSGPVLVFDPRQSDIR
jgi:two-component system sensor histidine kinase RpfC